MQLKESYWKPAEKDLRYYFHELFWKDILSVLDDPYFKMNAVSPLIEAIRKGTVKYQNGIFSGSFNMKISAELEKFAVYDGRSKTWKGFPPAAVASAAVIANDKARKLVEKINSLIDGIPARVQAAIESLRYAIVKPMQEMAADADKDLEGIGISVTETLQLSDRLVNEYINNQNLNIKNWTPKQIENLREMIKRNVLLGYNREELVKQISREYEVTMNKARFLARQETSLFMSEIRNERYESAGLEYYIWSTSNDIRVVGNPSGLYPEGTTGHGNHFALNGKVCKLSDPTVYADSIQDAKKGRWKMKSNLGVTDNEHPGQAFNCRCSARPVIV